ncbi:MAG: serine hydrolase [Cyanobacteria bacterium P01_A01_bin.135]
MVAIARYTAALLLGLMCWGYWGNSGNSQAAAAHLPAVAMAEPMDSATSPAADAAIALERLFTQPLDESWFTPQFLRQVPYRQIQGVLAQIAQGLGAYQSVAATQDGYEVKFAGGLVTAQILLAADGQIAELLFQPPIVPLTPEEAIAAFEASPHQVSLLITRNGDPLAELNADLPLAVGSSFKLAVLAALRAKIEAGTRRWDEVVTLQPQWKSLPSGMLQDWPDGSSLTLETLATLMISVSDNTATDALVHIMGRQAVESRAPHNQPFLTTREAFVLKNPENGMWLERYRQGDTVARRQVVAELGDRPLPNKALFAGDPVAPDVEWFFTARELCRLVNEVAALPLMRINPGVASPQRWSQVAFKGGSEPGVLNMTTQLIGAAGETYCMAATWNGETALDEAALMQTYRSIVLGLREGES